jgi:hypothetical protein
MIRARRARRLLDTPSEEGQQLLRGPPHRRRLCNSTPGLLHLVPTAPAALGRTVGRPAARWGPTVHYSPTHGAARRCHLPVSRTPNTRVRARDQRRVRSQAVGGWAEGLPPWVTEGRPRDQRHRKTFCVSVPGVGTSS